MFVTANPSTIALYGRKLRSMKTFGEDLRKDFEEGPASNLSNELRPLIESHLRKPLFL